ncbi:MAG: DNA repair protein RecN [Simkaniaceae bacterium]|nr:MAG: DNA repair protein RecN [Simkaniaceae bacterium]
MIHTLSLTSFVLINSTTITFDRGFHILTGETGAGKTLLIQAIHLLSGHKVSTQLIRAGDEKATIEATFDIEKLPEVHSILEEGGIQFDKGEFLIIRREVSRSSKNRIFINAQMAPLSLLALLGPHLLELVSQNSSQSIRQSETQRNLLDLYGDLQQEVRSVKQAYYEAEAINQELTLLKQTNQEDRLNRLKWEFEEWEGLNYQDGEEEILFEEYKSLANTKESSEALCSIQGGLDHPSLIPTLAQFQKLSNDPSLTEHLESAIVHLQEASFLVTKQLENIDRSPRRFEELEERLSILNRLKKKYHLESTEIPFHLKKLKEEIDTLENLDEKLAVLESMLRLKTDECRAIAHALSEKRRAAAKSLEKRLKEELHSLNFPYADTSIRFAEKTVGPSGIDEITIYLAANKGEQPASLSQKSSGGEVARFLFALKIILAEKEGLPTLIFDEIDANIGGETAALVGQKLKALGKKSQVLAITHFPQVARFADHHLQISKKEVDGRTLTEIKSLKSTEKEGELLRMLGGEQLKSFSL